MKLAMRNRMVWNTFTNDVEIWKPTWWNDLKIVSQIRLPSNERLFPDLDRHTELAGVNEFMTTAQVLASYKRELPIEFEIWYH